MIYGVPNEDFSNRTCCKVGCDEKAVWELTTGYQIEDVTDACEQHANELLAGLPLLGASRLAPYVVDHLDVVFDGPPETGKFVDLEGFYGSAHPTGPSPITTEGRKEGHSWVQTGKQWRLRIPVPGCWMFGT